MSRTRCRLSASVPAIVALLVGLLAAGPAGAVAGFGDVEAGRFYTEGVQWMVDGDITTGTSPTCFSPDDTVTRGQFAAFLWRANDRVTPSSPHPFDDVIEPWQQDPVSWLVEQGITTGTSSTTFSPSDPLTRGELAAMLHRLAGSPGDAPLHPFVDVVRPWQQAAVSWLVEAGITTGTTPTTFAPDELVTRGQVATFLYRYAGAPAVIVDPDTPSCGGPTPIVPGLPGGSGGFCNAPNADALLDCLVAIAIDIGAAFPGSTVCGFQPNVAALEECLRELARDFIEDNPGLLPVS